MKNGTHVLGNRVTRGAQCMGFQTARTTRPPPPPSPLSNAAFHTHALIFEKAPLQPLQYTRRMVVRLYMLFNYRENF